MTTYLLLRDNKQSGPYTFDELKEKGLKAYDLVWIEGKSAAWRYPSEIEELSAFAPIVEEQPFDRFYKKPSQIGNVLSSDKESPVRSGITSATPAIERSSSNPVVAASVISGETSSAPGRRIIYVTLPAPKAAPAVREMKEEPGSASPAHEKYLPAYSSDPLPALPADAPEENTAQYSGAWKQDVEIMPRTDEKSRSSRVGQSVVVALTVIALLTAGIFIGLSINKNASGFIKNDSLNNTREKTALNTPSAADHSPQTLAVNNPTTIQTQPPPPAKVSTAAADPAIAGLTNIAPSKTTGLSKDRLVPPAQKTHSSPAMSKDSSLLAVPAIQRAASHRADVSVEKVDKDVIRNNISNLVSIGASGYSVGTFGGITDLQLTVSNHSVYALDLVVVEVRYIQSNKKVFKTENLYFRTIAPGSALMQEAPKSSRGIKVAYKITLVNSKELGLSYSAL
jgi:hypothetical protein